MDEPAQAEEAQTVELQISCRHLLDMDLFSKSDPYVVLHLLVTTNTCPTWVEVGRTEVVMDDLNPDFKTSFLMDYLSKVQQLVKFEVFDFDAKLFASSSHSK